MNPNPSTTALSKDIRNYRTAFKDLDRPDVKKEIKTFLKSKHPRKYQKPPGLPATPDSTFTSLDAYEDFTLGGKPKSGFPLYRLGNALDQPAPKKPAPPDPPVPPVIFQNKTKITVREDGAIVHTGPDGKEIPEAHEYMDLIFDDILYDVRNYLERINVALECFNNTEKLDTKAGREYTEAVKAFNDYVAELQPGGDSPYAAALNFVNVKPVETNEGFFVSVRVELEWKNIFHSSSTIRPG